MIKLQVIFAEMKPAGPFVTLYSLEVEQISTRYHNWLVCYQSNTLKKSKEANWRFSSSKCKCRVVMKNWERGTTRNSGKAEMEMGDTWRLNQYPNRMSFFSWDFHGFVTTGMCLKLYPLRLCLKKAIEPLSGTVDGSEIRHNHLGGIFFEKIWDFKTIPTLNSRELINPGFLVTHPSSK